MVGISNQILCSCHQSRGAVKGLPQQEELGAVSFYIWDTKGALVTKGQHT